LYRVPPRAGGLMASVLMTTPEMREPRDAAREG
jgi:hypothetical protein